jgi:Skp family chaperone for outer membrane proteins
MIDMLEVLRENRKKLQQVKKDLKTAKTEERKKSLQNMIDGLDHIIREMGAKYEC